MLFPYASRFALSVLALLMSASLAGDCTALEDSESKKVESVETDPTESNTQTISADEGALAFEAPASWKKTKPANRLIEVELQIPAAEKTEDRKPEAKPGRLTMMAAGGDVETNMQRWVGQFRLGHDSDGKDTMTRKTVELTGAKLHLLDIAGTFFERPKGPIGPSIERPNYRMLGAIIEREDAGKFFVKFYGPDSLVTGHREAFLEMVKGVTISKADSEDDAGS